LSETAHILDEAKSHASICYLARSDDNPYTDFDLRRLFEVEAEDEVQTMPTPSPQREAGSPLPGTFTTELSSFARGADPEAEARLDLEIVEEERIW
jgi:hypothetical protein